MSILKEHVKFANMGQSQTILVVSILKLQTGIKKYFLKGEGLILHKLGAMSVQIATPLYRDFKIFSSSSA